MSAVVKPGEVDRVAQKKETIAQEFARFAAELDWSEVPADVVERAKLSILDALGIALASSKYDFAQRTAKALTSLDEGGSSVIIGMPIRLNLRDAVLLNGTLIHGLDYDDTHSSSILHASTSAVPVMLGQGIASNASGKQALLAYLLAVETNARIGMAADGGFHQAGFHPTGLVGGFGCALAAGFLRGLNAEQLTYAQGIVLSMAAGSLEFLGDGAWTKRMHPGWAGASAITAAALAGEGFVSPTRSYEGRYGLYNNYLKSSNANLKSCTNDLGVSWEMLNVAIKPYPICHFNHSFADAMLKIREEHGIRPDDVVSITARIHEKQVPVVCEPENKKRRPQSDYDAKFSLHYALATSLARGRLTLDELEDDVLQDPVILSLCDRIAYEADPQSAYPRYYSGEVEVSTRDGRSFKHREAVNRGSDANPLSLDDVREKFMANATRAVDEDQAERIFRAVIELEHADDLAELADAISVQPE